MNFVFKNRLLNHKGHNGFHIEHKVYDVAWYIYRSRLKNPLQYVGAPTSNSGGSPFSHEGSSLATTSNIGKRTRAREISMGRGITTSGQQSESRKSSSASRAKAVSMVKKNILLIEDEADIREMIRLRLKKEGFDVLTADSGEAGLALVLERRPDLVLLDLMLPIMSGFEVLRKIKAERTVSRVPILIVSARGEESDIVVGLELGADDFVTKPFTMTVLIARINALLRRSALPEDQVDHLLVAGPVQIDMTGYLAFLEGEPLILTKTEFHILYELVRAKGRVLTRNQLVEQAIGDAYVTDRTIDVHLTSLRNKLGNARALIETVRGVGYRFHGDAERSRM